MEHPIVINSNGKIGKAGENTIVKYLASPAGRARLAASMVAPLRTGLDYQSIARKVFVVEQLPSGALPIYSRDLDVAEIIQGTRVTVPQFEIASNPTINIGDVKKRHFYIIDRYKNIPTIHRSGYKRITIW